MICPAVGSSPSTGKVIHPWDRYISLEARKTQVWMAHRRTYLENSRNSDCWMQYTTPGYNGLWYESGLDETRSCDRTDVNSLTYVQKDTHPVIEF